MKKIFIPLYIFILLAFAQTSFAQTPFSGNSYSGPSSSQYSGPAVSQSAPASSTSLIPVCTFNKVNTKVGDIFDFGSCLIGRWIVPLMFMFATVIFVWGATQFILNSEEEAKRAQGRQFMIWGIIALAVAASVWGLVGILKTTFSLQTNAPKQQVSQ